MLTPQEYADKWAKNTKNGVQYYKDGVNKVTVAPGVAAAAKQDKMLAGIQEAVNSGKWANRVSSVNLTDWKNAAANKGAQRIAAGVDGAMPKQLKMAQVLNQRLEGAQSVLSSMPDNTYEERIQRMVAQVQYMHDNPVYG